MLLSATRAAIVVFCGFADFGLIIFPLSKKARFSLLASPTPVSRFTGNVKPESPYMAPNMM
jgi:hypothetical protein